MVIYLYIFAIGGEYAVGLVEGETIVQRKEKHTLAGKAAREPGDLFVRQKQYWRLRHAHV